MRMFVAITPPEEAVEDLDGFLEPRREASRFRWTVPESWHLTLAFLAHVPDRALDDLTERLADAAARRTPFRLRLSGGGAFPDPSRAKVLFAGVECSDPDELDRLSLGARSAAARAGAPPDGATFRPHVTLARMNRPVEATRWLRVLSAYDGPDWEASEVALVESFLGEGPRGRPRYETRASFALGG